MVRRDVRRGLVVVAASLVLSLTSACGEEDSGDEPGTSVEALGAGEVREAIRADADRVATATRDVAPVMAEAAGGRVGGAAGNVEGCEGGSFDGPTAFGYQARGAVDGLPADAPQQLAEKVGDALDAAGWSDVTLEDGTPGRVGVSAESDGPVVAITFDEDTPGEALFTVRGRCLPVTDEGREAALDLIESREIIPNR